MNNFFHIILGTCILCNLYVGLGAHQHHRLYVSLFTSRTIDILYSVLSIILDNGGEGGAQIIQNIYFIEHWTENKTVICLIERSASLCVCGAFVV